METKKISVLTPCYNEQENIAKVYQAVSSVFQNLPQYTYEHVFIDNNSNDKTVSLLKEIAAKDKNVKIIVNARNFGHIRSPFYGMLQCNGEAVISLVADLQDPPEVIVDFLKKWEEGFKIVIGVKKQSKENALMFACRKFFYGLLSKMSTEGEPPIKNFTGFGLYDKDFINVLKTLEYPYPYFRGLIT